MTVGPENGSPNTRWAILTGEYPPQPGGVSDYAQLVAEALAALGDDVVVFAPPQAVGPDPCVTGVRVRRLPDRFGLRGLHWLDRELARLRPDRILIHYVPHAFGLKAMNFPFTTWVANRAVRLAPVWVMFHEVAFPFVRRPLRHNLLAVVNRAMARSIAVRADRILVSIPAWAQILSDICRTARSAEWLPIPCCVATTADPQSIAAVRSRYAPNVTEPLVGHFGTFGRLMTELLAPSVSRLVSMRPHTRVLLLGRGSEEYRARLSTSHPDVAAHVAASGELSAGELAVHLRACDLLLQPYPDGVSTRRTSVMAGLANRVPVVSNLGRLSEPLWTASTGVTVVPTPDPVALATASFEVLALSSANRLALGARGEELYQTEFSLERTVARLREQTSASVAISIRC